MTAACECAQKVCVAPLAGSHDCRSQSAAAAGTHLSQTTVVVATTPRLLRVSVSPRVMGEASIVVLQTLGGHRTDPVAERYLRCPGRRPTAGEITSQEIIKSRLDYLGIGSHFQEGQRG